VKRATKILGVSEGNVVFLDFVDGTLKDDQREVEEKVVQILRENRPDEVYIPYKRDGHPDHRAAYKIVKNALKKLGGSPVCYMYSITHRFARVGRFIDGFLDVLFRNKKIYVDVSEFLHVKKLAIMEFNSELTAVSARQHKPIIASIGKFEKEKEIFLIERSRCEFNS